MTTAKKTPAKVEHPLAHLIPPAEIADAYIPRKVGGEPKTDSQGTQIGYTGGRVDLNLLNYAYKRSCNEPRVFSVALNGPTGSGKTAAVRAFAAKQQIPIVTINGADGFDPLTAFGRYVPTEDGAGIRWAWSEIGEVIRHGGLLYIDEINFLRGDQTAILHPLLDARRGVSVIEKDNEWVPAHPELFVVSTYNLGSGYAGTKTLNQALLNRFPLKLEWGYSIDVEHALTGSRTLVSLANGIRQLFNQGVIKTAVSTNALVEFAELTSDIDIAFAAENFLQVFPESERGSIRERISVEDLLVKIKTEIEDAFEIVEIEEEV